MLGPNLEVAYPYSGTWFVQHSGVSVVDRRVRLAAFIAGNRGRSNLI